MNFKKIKNIFDKKKGIFISKLSPKDHELILNLVEQHFSHLTSEIKSKEKINLDNYLTHAKNTDHASLFNKLNRMLPEESVKIIEHETELFSSLRDIFPELIITDEENLGYSNIYWRLVRPLPYKDVGSMHKDKWFWDLNKRKIDKKFQRFKLWVSLINETEKLGFKYVDGSADIDFKFKSEKKEVERPIIDEEMLKRFKTTSLAGSKGDFIIFHDEILHGGELLDGKKCRLSAEFTFLVKKINF